MFKRLNKFIPFVVFLLGMAVTLVATLTITRLGIMEEKALFEGLVQKTEEAFQDRFETYVTLLRSSSGLFAASDVVTKNEFKTFVDVYDLHNKYPGVQGIGFAKRVLPDNKDGSMRTAIIYLEPLDVRNQAAMGFDMYSEPVRRAAMDKAWMTGQPAATGKVTLKQEIGDEKQAGFLLYLAVYQKNMPLNTQEQRRKALVGFVYSPYRVEDLFNNIFEVGHHTGVGMRVYDGESQSENNLIYTSGDFVDEPLFEEPHVFDLFGERWLIDYHANGDLPPSFERRLTPLVLGIGVILSLVLFVITKLQNDARSRIESVASNLRVSKEVLRQSQERYRLVVDNASDLINILDLEGNYLYASPSYQETLGYKPEVLVGKSIFENVHPEDVGIVKRQLVQATKGKPIRAVYRIAHRNGHYLIIEGLRKVIKDMANKPFLIITVARDVTLRVELEKRKDDFISMASHELKTPLTSLKIYTELLFRRISKRQQAEAEAEEQTYLVKMNKQINKMVGMINDLLDVSRIESGKIVMNITEVEVEKVVRETCEDIARSVKHKLIVEGHISSKAYGDKERLGQVVGNLLNNAIKFSPEADRVLVKLKEENRKILVAVQDFGVGIKKEDQKRIFEKFYQTEGAKVGSASGLGLGLYITSEIIRRHKGKIWVESEVGKGSTFYFSLPVAK